MVTPQHLMLKWDNLRKGLTNVDTIWRTTNGGCPTCVVLHFPVINYLIFTPTTVNTNLF